MSGFGNPRYLCEECEKDLDDATLSREPETISEAIEKIGKKIQAANNDDALILKTVSEIIDGATERGEMIRNGVYDFENDEQAPEEEIEEVPDELLETEEDKALDKREAEKNAKIDKVLNWVTLGVFVAALGYIAYWVISRFL